MRLHPGLLRVSLSLALFGVCGSAVAQTPKPTPFTKEVEKYFGEWDKDHDGTLEAGELDALVVNADIKGTQAAAVAALKAAQRSGKFELPPLTLDYFHRYESEIAAKKKVSPAFDQAFMRGSRRISRTRRDIFADGVPSLETCHQGPLGDCFFVSVVGASVARNPEEVHSMIATQTDGSLLVSFPNGKSVNVPALTDTELALTSTTGNDGLWLAVLEKAYGKIRNDGLPESRQHESTTDAIARGGSTVSTIRLLTGHAVARVGLRPRQAGQTRSHKPDADAKEGETGAAPTIDPAVLQKHLDEVLPKLRDQLVEAMANHRLAAAGTPKEGVMPPGINASHAYAILGYDREKDIVHLWNPHGNTFHPKGEAGLKNGYPTKAGQFDMPLTEMGQVFAGVTIETDQAGDEHSKHQ